MALDEGTLKTYSNGFRLYVKTMPDAAHNYAELRVAAGAASDPDEFNGRAHVFEHLVFQGTKSKTHRDVATLMRGYGCRDGTVTGPETTKFTLNFNNAKTESLTGSIVLLHEMLMDTAFQEDRMVHEKGVILQEMAQRRDEPMTRFVEYRNSRLYANSPYARSTGGTAEIVRKLERQDLIDYRDMFYTPDRMILCVAGPVEFEAVDKAVEQCFGMMPAQSKLHSELPVAINIGYSRLPVRGFLSQNFMTVAFPVDIGASSSNCETLYMFEDLLEDELGRYRQRTNLTYNIARTSKSFLAKSITGITARSLPETSADLMNALSGMLKNLPEVLSDQYLEYAQSNLRAYYKKALATPAGVCGSQMGHIASHDRPFRLEDIFDIVASVNLSNIKGLASTIVSAKPAFITMGPTKVSSYSEICRSLKAP